MVDIQSPTAEIRRGKKEERKRKKPQGKNIMACPAIMKQLVEFRQANTAFEGKMKFSRFPILP